MRGVSTVVGFSETILGGENIDCVNNFNFLGIVLNQHLNWHSHTTKIANKICKIIGILNKLKHILPQQILSTIYTSNYTSCKLWHFTLKYLFLVITKIIVMFQIVIYANLEIYAKNNITTRLLHY